MNSIVNNMPKYDHRQHVLSDWLAELEQRSQLGEVGEDKHKITWCQLLIGATGSSIFSGLEDDTSWETVKETLLSRLGIGSVKDEAWVALKHLKKGSKEIVELAGEAEKLAKRLHPRDEEAAERHAIDAFSGALERPLAAEVQKLGCRTQEDVVAAARRIEKVLEEQTDFKMERLITAMQDQIRFLKRDLKDAHDQISVSATPTAALAASPTATVAAAHLPPLAQPPSMAAAQPPSLAATQPPPPAAAQPPPLATAQPPPYRPARHLYQDYADEGPYFRAARHQQDRRPPRCFLCGEEGHFVSHCPARSVLQRLLCQQTRETPPGPPRGQVLELPPVDDSSQGSTQAHLNC